MPTFSEDPVVDFCVAEAVIRAGSEAEREAEQEAQANSKRKGITEGHRDWAKKQGLVS